MNTKVCESVRRSLTEALAGTPWEARAERAGLNPDYLAELMAAFVGEITGTMPSQQYVEEKHRKMLDNVKLVMGRNYMDNWTE